MANDKKKASGVQAERKRLEEFCRDHLKPGRHFGTIHRRNCPDTGSSSWDRCRLCGAKPGLWKEGAERICEYMGVLVGPAELERELVEVAGGDGWVCFRITLYLAENNGVLGHGIGAHKHADPNIMVKKAKKNALIDGVKTTFALSDLFDDADGSEGRGVQTSADAGGQKPAGKPAGKRAAPGGRAAPASSPPRQSAPPAPPVNDAAEDEGGGDLPKRKPPSWWKIKAEFPTARWTVLDRDDREYNIMGVIHFPCDTRALVGGGRRRWSPFEPRDGKPEFKTKPPFPEWAALDWYGLLEWAIKHRLKRKSGDETNNFNDPFHHLLADRYNCVYQGAVLPIAEQAAALDYIAWGLVQKNNGVVPEWAADALAESQQAQLRNEAGERQAAAPAAAPAEAEDADAFAMDDEDVPF